MNEAAFLFRSPTALWLGGSWSRRRGRARPAVRQLGQSTCLLSVLDTEWKRGGSNSRSILVDQWRLHEPAQRQPGGERLAWGHLSVHSDVSHLRRKQQAIQSHSDRSVDAIKCNQHIDESVRDDKVGWSFSSSLSVEKTLKLPLYPIIAGVVVVCLTGLLAVVSRWTKISKVKKCNTYWQTAHESELETVYCQVHYTYKGFLISKHKKGIFSK